MRIFLPFIKGFKMFISHSALGWGSIFALTTLIFIMQVFLIIESSLSSYIESVAKPSELRVYVTDGGDNSINAVKQILDNSSFIGTTRAFTSEEVFNRAVGKRSSETNLSFASSNYYPQMVIGALLEYSETELVLLSNKLIDIKGVETISYGKDSIITLQKFAEYIIYALLSIGLFMLLCVMFITYITVDLTLFKFLDEIKVYNIIGATDNYIAIAYIVDTIFVVSFSFLLSYGAAYALVELGNLYLLDKNILINLTFIDIYYEAVLYGIIVFTAIISSYITVKRFVKQEL